MYADRDIIQLWLEKPVGWFSSKRGAIEGAAFDIDGTIYQPRRIGRDDWAFYIIPRAVLRQIGAAKAVTITAEDPKWNYTLSDEQRKSIGDLAKVIAKIRSVE
jgi:hypothetical protein